MTARLTSAAHLGRRFVGMLSRRTPAESDVAWVAAVLSDAEFDLWRQLPAADQRHSVCVGRRFESSAGGAGSAIDADRDALAAALLHDIGKLSSGLGVFARVAATIVGPRTPRFRMYHDHERIGGEMLSGTGSSRRTVELVDGTSPDHATVAAIQHADDI